MRVFLSILVFVSTISFVQANDETVSKKDYILGNTLLTLYHEFGHAIVDNLRLPVLGREEDAVDFFSILMVENKISSRILTQSQENQLDDFLWATADAWLAYSESEELDDSSFASDHSVDLQRFYQHICLVYGSDPELYENMVVDFELDLSELGGCEDKFADVEENWMSVLKPSLQTKDEPGDRDEILVFIHQPNDRQFQSYYSWVKNWPWLTDFQVSMSSTLRLPEPITVVFTECGEANAFFDSEDNAVTICYEQMDVYETFYDQLQ